MVVDFLVVGVLMLVADLSVSGWTVGGLLVHIGVVLGGGAITELIHCWSQ